MVETELVKKFKKSYEIKMSPNSKYIGHFSSSAVSLFDAENNLQIADFRDVKYPSHITFSSDSKLLAVKSNQKKIAVYDLEKLELIKMFNIKKNSQPQDFGFCFTYDKKYILNLVYTNDLLGYISKINVETLHEERFFEGSTCVFTYIQYIEAKEQYLITGFDRTIDEGININFIMWYSATDNSFERINLDFEIHQIVYHEETKTFVGWELGGQSLKVISNDFINEIPEDEYIILVAFSKNGRYIAVVLSKTVNIYEYPKVKLICAINNKNNCYAEFSPDDKHILIGAWGNGYIYKLNF